MLQEIFQISQVGVNGDLVLPLELRPHAAELFALALGRADVVHDV